MKRLGTSITLRRCCAFFSILWLGFSVAPAAEPVFRDSLRRFVSQRKEGETKSEQPPPGFSNGVEQAIGLEYSVMLHKDGIDEPVDPHRHRFHAGDQIRVRIQPLNDLYIYVFFEDPQGSRRCLLPNDKNSPRLARYDQPVELPSDGSVFEFEAAADQETLTIVATEQPDMELTTLCELVCKKRGDRLTAEERSLQAELKGKNERAVAVIQNRQQRAVIYRGQLSNESMGRVSSDMKQRGAQEAVVEEPPGDKQTSTLVAMFSNSTAPPKLLVTIPLKSKTTSPAAAPRLPRG